VKNEWDIFSSSAAIPSAEESLEAVASTPEENSCTFPA
jgi:branched-chain amino acid transport system substrate-binding protein